MKIPLGSYWATANMPGPEHPTHLKNFDPKTFWPAITPRSDSLSIYPSSSLSEARARRPSLQHSYDPLNHVTEQLKGEF